MPSYKNSDHAGRLVIIPVLRAAFAEISVSKKPLGAIPTQLAHAIPTVELFQVNEIGDDGGGRDVFNFPFLFRHDGRPWVEANSYFLSLVRHKHLKTRPTDDVRRLASRLLEYLMFCESNGIDWLDFSGKRPSHRPTYRYYRHLLDKGGKAAAVINQHTGAVYNFYTFVAQEWHPLDITRVDTVKQIKVLLATASGTRTITVEKRSQTRPTPRESPVPIGFVRDEGEDLRPLTNPQLSELLEVLEADSWSMQERLILLTALMTGARKQTILTLRRKHLRHFSEDRLQRDGTYLIHAGPGTGIDTKFDKPQVLRFPKQLADDLMVWARSPTVAKRQSIFRQKLEREFPRAKVDEDDLYIFLSDQGNCYYMAQEDPRYPVVKSRPTGQVTETLKRKLRNATSEKFPNAFTYHWLRATFAFQLYQHLIPLLKSGAMQPGEEISLIQERLHHADRTTTENYLKLFSMHSAKLIAQENYESRLFKFSSYDDLILESENV
jgi:integrase